MEDHGGQSYFSFPNEKWLRGGYQLFLYESGDSSRDFWIWQSLVSESEIGFANHAPAFWSCANKMMTCLLSLADPKDDHGVMPHSLKVTTISAIMSEIAKGNANLSQLAIQGNCSAVAAQDMGNVYSRNLAQHQIFVSNLDLNAHGGNKTAESLTSDLPGIPGENQSGENPRTLKSQGGRPIGCPPF